ncbi:MAG TPA: hypothetical protein VMU84_10635 [Thermoanaerobaculia bacterium]|nr:hypothetical protein [Thermoanaerobaculia bacterium]
MNELAEKVREVERDIAKGQGPLNLFALFEREDLYDQWDLVVAAPWAEHDLKTLGYIADALRRHLTRKDMVRIARIVILPANEDPVLTLNKAFDVEHGDVELLYPARFGLPVKFGYIITSRSAA